MNPTTDPKIVSVACSTQAEVDERVPTLFDKYAPLREIRLDPLRGPIDLEGDSIWNSPCPYCIDQAPDWETNVVECRRCDCTGKSDECGVDRVVVRGGTEPLHPQWVRDLRDQCEAAGVAFEFLGWGSWFPSEMYDYDRCRPALSGRPEIYLGPNGQILRTSSPFEHGCPACTPPGYVSMVKIGPSRSGRTLDGKIHDGDGQS